MWTFRADSTIVRGPRLLAGLLRGPLRFCNENNYNFKILFEIESPSHDRLPL